MIVDAGADFPADIRAELDAFGSDMWRFRPSSQGTTRAMNKYQGELRESGSPTTLLFSGDADRD